MQIELAEYPNTVSKPATNMNSRIAILLSSLSDDEAEDGRRHARDADLIWFGCRAHIPNLTRDALPPRRCAI